MTNQRIIAVIHGTKEINVKPQITATIPCYAPQSNKTVIDLTDSNEISVSNSVSMTEQKSKNSRQRRFHEIDTKKQYQCNGQTFEANEIDKSK